MKVLAAAVTALMLLAGCSEAPPPINTPATPGTQMGPGDDLRVVDINVNGRLVTCIVWGRYREGGLSCDWANAK